MEHRFGENALRTAGEMKTDGKSRSRRDSIGNKRDLKYFNKFALRHNVVPDKLGLSRRTFLTSRDMRNNSYQTCNCRDKIRRVYRHHRISYDSLIQGQIMQRFQSLFPKHRCSVVGMIHVGGLPGTPRFNGNRTKLIDDAVRDAEIYRDAGLDGILVENMHDIPYVRAANLGPETTAMMARICSEVRKIVPASVACGVQVLAGGNTHAIAIAQAANFQFIRAEGFVFGHVADEGFIDACAGQLLRYRRKIGADDVLVFADIKKKHSSHAITADVNLVETAKAAEFFLADGVILTGIATGKPADEQELKGLLETVQGPVIIGSGVDEKNLQKYVKADAVIVGSHFKVDGTWENPVDPIVVNNFMSHLSRLCNIENKK